MDSLGQSEDWFLTTTRIEASWREEQLQDQDSAPEQLTLS
jgi:hypothetical protein